MRVLVIRHAAVNRLAEHHQFSVYVKNDAVRPLKAFVIGQLSIECRDVAGNEVGRSWSTPWDASLSSTSWTMFSVAGTAPAGAVKAHFVIVEKGEGQPAAGCVFLADDAAVMRM